MKHPLMLALAAALGLVLGRALPRPAESPGLVRASAELPAAASPISASIDRACKAQLASANAQLAICRAFKPELAEPSPSRTVAEMDEETAKLVRAGATNTTTVLVRSECGTRTYLPGTWPPPDGPPAGARIVARAVDGGMEFYGDGGAHYVATDQRPMLCPCPRDDDAPSRAQVGH